VVRETSAGVPIETPHSIMLVHGDLVGFRHAFGGLPLALAQSDIDVWGMSMRWTLVPAGTTDLSFMKEWGLALHVEDLRLAMAIARQIRYLEGNGRDKMHLLGYSTGGWIGYAIINAEVALDESDRQIKGYIPVDTYIKTDDPEIRKHWCNSATDTEAKRAQGIYHNDNSFFLTFARLALSDPNGTSPFMAPLTNREFALAAGGASYVGFNGNEPAPFYHWFAASWTPDYSKPTGLAYSDEAAFLEEMSNVAPFQANKLSLDNAQLVCDSVDLPYNDHLSRVTVPTLYVGAGGGFGEYGVYSTTLLGGSDHTNLVIHLASGPEGRRIDYGHIDLMAGGPSRTLVFPQLARWINAH